jgi:protein-L-isoaspartate(D-aspartate) O-methyltransferase
MNLNLDRARTNMVEQQIRPWAVLNQTVLNTFRFLPREKFVPTQWQNLAFADTEIPLLHGESMMFPRVEARMLQDLDVQPNDECLEIGTGSGFVTACLAHMGKHVDSVDIYADLSQQAEKALHSVDINNFNLYIDDAGYGWEGNPGKQYDVIAVTGSIPSYIPAFEQRLNVGGRLFIIVGKSPTMQAMLVTREDQSQFDRRVLFETVLKPLDGTEPQPEFRF